MKNLNIILYSDVITVLLETHTNDIKNTFIRLQRDKVHFWIPSCLLPLLYSQFSSEQKQAFDELLTHVEILSSLAIHWQEIPADHPDKIHALVSLDAGVLPDKSIIWTNEDTFHSKVEHIEYGDHEVLYSILAEQEYDNQYELYDLASTQLTLRPELEKRIFGILKQGRYILTPEINELEVQLANYVNSRYCISVASGADALRLALMAVGIQAGDEVITSPFTDMCTVNTISLLGAKPVFVDINPQTFSLNVEELSHAITPQTKAIVAASLYGQCADFDSINKIAGEHGLPVIEEGSQSFGATYKNRDSCALSTIGCTSFHSNLPFGTYGDGGACFTNDVRLAERMRSLRMQGRNRQDKQENIGISSYFNSLQAAILLEKLTAFPKEVAQRIRVGNLYTEALQMVVTTPYVEPHNTSIYSHYIIDVENRDQVRESLLEQGVHTAIHCPTPAHLHPAYQHLNYAEGQFIMAEVAAQRTLSLPMYTYFSEDDIEYISNALKQATNFNDFPF